VHFSGFSKESEAWVLTSINLMAVAHYTGKREFDAREVGSKYVYRTKSEKNLCQREVKWFGLLRVFRVFHRLTRLIAFLPPQILRRCRADVAVMFKRSYMVNIHVTKTIIRRMVWFSWRKIVPRF